MAIQKRAREDLKHNAIFDALAQNPEAICDPEQGILSKSAPAKGAVVELIREYVKRLDASYESGWLADPLVETREVAEAKTDIALELAIASDHTPQTVRKLGAVRFSAIAGARVAYFERV